MNVLLELAKTDDRLAKVLKQFNLLYNACGLVLSFAVVGCKGRLVALL
jgi:hypothetical protein